MTIYGEVWWRFLNRNDPYYDPQVISRIEVPGDLDGLITAIHQSAPREDPKTGKPFNRFAGDELFLENVFLSRDPDFFIHNINDFVDRDPRLRQMLNGQHEEMGWMLILNKDLMRVFIAKLDEAIEREKEIFGNM